MAQIFKPQRKPKAQVAKQARVRIDELDHQGQGVARAHQPVLFVEGALPGELCDVTITRQASGVAFGKAKKLIETSPQRVSPFCPHVEQCGGCQTQHVESSALQQTRQRAIGELIRRSTGKAPQWAETLSGEEQGYRRKARLAIDNQHKDQFRIGFRAANSKQVVSIEQCPVLVTRLQAIFPAVVSCVSSLKGKKALGHVTLLAGDEQIQLCLRIIRELPAQDLQNLQTLASEHNLQLVLQRDDAQFECINGDSTLVHYAPKEGISLAIGADDFVQVNGVLNQKMVTQALDWLTLNADDKVLDLFCGVGNFTLPIATQAGSVVGVEGVDSMVQRAERNAERNQIENVRFVCADLESESWTKQADIRRCNKVLLDPARAGAQFAMQALSRIKPQRIVYVSCNPATFARDAGALTKQGYRLEKISLIDMFPGTAHSELMALFIPNRE